MKKLKVFTNMKNIKGSKYNPVFMPEKEMLDILKEKTVLFLDTETMAKDFDDEKVLEDYIQEHIASGKKVTKTTKKSAEKHLENLRGQYALDPHRSLIRLVQIATTGVIYIFDYNSSKDKLNSLFKTINGKFICGHNLKFDLKVIFANYPFFEPGEIFCTMMGHKVDAYANTLGYIKSSLYDVVSWYLNIQLEKGYAASDWRKEISAEQFDYSVEDVLYLKDVFEMQVHNINSRSIKQVTKEQFYFNGMLQDKVAIIEMQFVEVLARIELRGAPINDLVLKKHAESIKQQLNSIDKKFKSINTKSPQQITDFLSKEGIHVSSTSKNELVRYKEFQSVKDLITIKRLQKELQMVEDYLNIWKQPDGRIYGQFNQQRGAAGRMSAYEPNLQQIPRVIKNIFYKSTKNNLIIKADYPAIEARLCAVVCNDMNMINIFKSGIDIHNYTTSQFLHKPIEQITEDERQKGKSANFGFMFGMGALTYTEYAFANYGLEVSIEEARDTRNSYLKAYPKVLNFHNMNSKKLREQGFVHIKTLLGRIVKVDSFTNANNYPIQGSAADMIKLAAVLFYKKCKAQRLHAHIINVVHDEIVVEIEFNTLFNKGDKVRKQLKEKVKAALEESMNMAADYIIKVFETKVKITEVK